MRRVALVARVAVAVATTLAACTPELGVLPARCDDGATCPEGYDCIRGICAAPGTQVPATIATLQYLRPDDWQLILHGDRAVAVWERYDYERERSAFEASTISREGAVDAPRVLVEEYPADSDNLEPYFDVHSAADGSLLVAVAAAPFDGTDAPRLSLFRSSLDAPVSEPRWEVRMRSLGYGAVSQPRFAIDGGGLALGYFESFATAQRSGGELALFGLDDAGEPLAPLDPGACAGSPSCCQAARCVAARDGSTLAVGVDRVFSAIDETWWLLDDVRPSFVRRPLDSNPTTGALPREARAVAATNAGLLVLSPIDDGVALVEVPVDGSGGLGPAAPRATLEGIALDPRPAWIERPGRDPLVAATTRDGVLVVGAVASAGLRAASPIERWSSRAIASIRAIELGDRVLVAWLEEGDDVAVLRAVLVDSP